MLVGTSRENAVGGLSGSAQLNCLLLRVALARLCWETLLADGPAALAAAEVRSTEACWTL